MMQRDLPGPHLMAVVGSEVRERNREQEQHHRAHQSRRSRAVLLPQLEQY